MSCAYAVFTSLKPADGVIGEIQRKSFDNWKHVFAGAEIVRFVGPLVPFAKMVQQVERKTDSEVLMYANGDLLFEEGISVVIGRIDIYGDFLLTGQRIDILADGSKRLHRPSGMDYFVFRRGMFHDLPKVLMGRAHCDSALVAYCLRKNIPVVDASFALRVEHQFHDYNHVAGGKNEVWIGRQAQENIVENDLRPFGPHCIDATHSLLPDGSIVPNIRSSSIRGIETALYYRRGYKWCPRFNQFWNILTRGGKYCSNPVWDGVLGI